MDLFTGKVALVTGGGSGIGRAASLLFAKHGAKIMITDQNEASAAAVAAEVNAAGGDAISQRCDVTNKAAIESMVAETVAKYGRLDCAFNNAGITHAKDHE